MADRKESYPYTLYGDLEGKTVADLRKMLDEYPDHARVDVRSEFLYGYSSGEERESFIFVWEE